MSQTKRQIRAILLIEIRIHGRGGQGAVTSAEILAKAAGIDNKFSQAFPHFGPERRGAPVRAYVRIDDKPITTRQRVYKPDYVIILDSSLSNLPEVGEGLTAKSVILNNTTKETEISGKKTKLIDASTLAMEVIGKPIVNTAMLGAFVSLSGLIKIGSLKQAVGNRFGGKVGELNQELAQRAFDEMERKKKENTA